MIAYRLLTSDVANGCDRISIARVCDCVPITDYHLPIVGGCDHVPSVGGCDRVPIVGGCDRVPIVDGCDRVLIAGRCSLSSCTKLISLADLCPHTTIAIRSHRVSR